MNEAEKRAKMPMFKNTVIDRRTVVNGNANLLQLVSRGMHVLDVGCGSGTITKDIARLVGEHGNVVGIDTSKHLIDQAEANYSSINNLSFAVADINSFNDNKYDVVTSARVLQWLANPYEVLQKMVNLAKPGGCVTILDYNHEKIEFMPEIPASMQRFYTAFLNWRQDAGMDNAIVDHLSDMMSRCGLINVSVDDYSETSIKGRGSFDDDADIWNKVAEGRGPQLVADKYISEEARLSSMRDYSGWIRDEGQVMRLYLKAVTGYKPA